MCQEERRGNVRGENSDSGYPPDLPPKNGTSFNVRLEIQ